MYTLLKPIKVRESLLNKGVNIFTPEVFSRIFQTKASQTKYFLEEQVNGRLFLRLKRGLYSLNTDQPGEEEIANALYRPSYISFEYALAYYNILPEMTYTVTSATTKATRLFTVAEKGFSYRTIKRSVFTGYILVQKEGKTFLIADPEKALVDYLYFVSMNKISSNDRLIKQEIAKLDKDKIVKYSKLYARAKLDNLVNETI